MHMSSKKDLSSGELDTLKRSRSPVTVVTAKGEVQTNEEAQVYVHDLQHFVTVSCSKKFLPYCPWANFAKSTVTFVSGPVVVSQV